MWRCLAQGGPVIGGSDAAPLAHVAGLRAELVPVREFPLRKWYCDPSQWYYHAPATEHALRPSPRFFEQIDPCLRALCRLVLDAGLATTPSCQGHFYPRAHFRALWRQLQQERALVRTTGLPVHDSETDARFLFRDGAYELPWTAEAQFCTDAARHQQHGYIGIAIPPRRRRLVTRLAQGALHAEGVRMARDAELTRALGQPLLSVHVLPKTARKRDVAWQRVTTHLRRILQEPEGDQAGTRRHRTASPARRSGGLLA